MFNRVFVAGKERSLATGIFGTLSDDLTVEILRRLPLRDQLLCATAICHSWRKSFRNHPGLFHQLNFLCGGIYVRLADCRFIASFPRVLVFNLKNRTKHIIRRRGGGDEFKSLL